MNSSRPSACPRRRLLVLLAIVTPFPASAADSTVESIAELKAAIAQAAPGDTLTVKNGVYTTSSAITVNRSGEPDRPITIIAESVGGVEINGTNGFNVAAPASHIVISGFVFTHASGKNSIAGGTSNVRFTRNAFQCTGDGPYLQVSGDDAQVDHNEFREKKTAGSMMTVSGTGSQVARRLWVHHNYFHDYASTGATTGEMIRLGLSTLGLSTGGAIVEHNLFARSRGESELVSNRSSGNIFRYNTFIDSPNAQLSLRHGNDCQVYGNYFRNTEGLRIYGDRHQIHSNYFEGNYIGINLGNGSTEVATGGEVSGHDRPDDCLIAFNTLVDNRTHYQMSRRTPEPLGATRTLFVNNLLQGSGIAVKIEGPYLEPEWSNNLVWTSGGPGDLPATGYSKVDPLLVKGEDGISRPQPGSPAIEGALGSFQAIAVDLDGQPRPEKKSIGADEPGTEGITARLLTPEHVGPAAK